MNVPDTNWQLPDFLRKCFAFTIQHFCFAKMLTARTAYSGALGYLHCTFAGNNLRGKTKEKRRKPAVCLSFFLLTAKLLKEKSRQLPPSQHSCSETRSKCSTGAFCRLRRRSLPTIPQFMFRRLKINLFMICCHRCTFAGSTLKHTASNYKKIC